MHVDEGCLAVWLFRVGTSDGLAICVCASSLIAFRLFGSFNRNPPKDCLKCPKRNPANDPKSGGGCLVTSLGFAFSRVFSCYFDELCPSDLRFYPMMLGTSPVAFAANGQAAAEGAHYTAAPLVRTPGTNQLHPCAEVPPAPDREQAFASFTQFPAVQTSASKV